MLDARTAQQARVLQHPIAQSGISVFRPWWHYFSRGGDVGELEVDAYLHQALHLPRLQRQLLDHAAHELVNDWPGPQAGHPTRHDLGWLLLPRRRWPLSCSAARAPSARRGALVWSGPTCRTGVALP